MQREQIKLISRVLSGALTVFLAILVVANVYTIIARAVSDDPQPTFLGYSSAVVISGSMSDTIEVNDFIVCKARHDYDVDDIITFISPRGSLITHRIVSESDAGFITQGDANNTPDSEPVPQESIVGKVVCIIPKIGLFIEFMRTPLGMTCVVLIGLLLLALPSVMERAEEESGKAAPQNGGNNEDGTESEFPEK